MVTYGKFIFTYGIAAESDKVVSNEMWKFDTEAYIWTLISKNASNGVPFFEEPSGAIVDSYLYLTGILRPQTRNTTTLPVSVWKYYLGDNKTSSSWSRIASMTGSPQSVLWASAAFADSTSVTFCGGAIVNTTFPAKCYTLHVNENPPRWSGLPLNSPYGILGMGVASNGVYSLAVGGYEYGLNNETSKVYYITQTGQAWSPISVPASFPARTEACVAQNPQGEGRPFYIIGGISSYYDNNNNYHHTTLSDVWVYNFNDSSFRIISKNPLFLGNVKEFTFLRCASVGPIVYVSYLPAVGSVDTSILTSQTAVSTGPSLGLTVGLPISIIILL
ncbi:hypothetical protein HK096_011058, partial [Nowakowskiella sp. JEL0078]